MTRKDNDVIKILILHTTLNKRLVRKLPSVRGRAIQLSELEKSIFLKNCLKEKDFLKFKPVVMLTVRSMKGECFLHGKG